MKTHVLMYHDVVSGTDFRQSGFSQPGADLYKLTSAQFAQHLQALEQALPEAPGLVTSPKTPPWMITFDDGGVGAMLAADLLEERNWRGHFFITTAMLDQPGFLTSQQVRELARRGHVIGSHSNTHPVPISHLSLADLRMEWETSVGLLSDLLGGPPPSASVPGGFHSPAVGAAAAAAGIRFLFTSEPVSRVTKLQDHAEYGRFSIQQPTSAGKAVAFASGGWPCLQQRAGWETRKIAKRLLGPLYLRLRAQLLKQNGPC